MSKIIEVTDQNFENEVIDSNTITVVDFWATWCGPCRKLSPILETLSEKYGNKVKFVKIKADENIETAKNYSIIGVPCILIFKNAKPVERIVNLVPQSVIENTINKYL